MAEIVVMPKLNLTMEEGVIVEWGKKVGDAVKADEVLCSIETEKSVVEMESPTSGVLLKVWGEIGERYSIKTPIALIGQPDEDVSALIEQVDKKLGETPTEESKDKTPIIASQVAPEARIKVKMLPKVRNLVKELGVDVASLVAYCGDRKITEEEVLAFKKTAQSNETATVKVDSRDRRIPLSTMRRTIAANMSESSQKTARLTNVTEVDMTKVKEKLNQRKEEKLSLTALVVKACAAAIKEHEIINTVMDKNDLVYKADINIGVAVDVPGGLVVPVIHSADTKDVIALTREIVDFSIKANQGGLTQVDFDGGTFTVTNVGMLGVEYFTPIINYPQTAIMGIGAIRRLPRYLDEVSNSLEARYIMNLCLTYDHRVIDGAPAARFSLLVRDLLESADSIFI